VQLTASWASFQWRVPQNTAMTEMLCTDKLAGISFQSEMAESARNQMHQYDPVSLRLFVTVCEERSIALAASREGIVPSAVSKRIAAIEHHTGTRLLDRGRRGVTVTPAGETLWRYARELLQTMERMHAELGEFAQGVQGNVRVFATMSAIAQFLPDDISTFIKKHQRVKVSIDERVSSEVVRGVEEGRADLGVCWDAVDMRRLTSFPYRQDQLVVIAHPDHPLARRRSVAFEDTIDFEYVDIMAGSIIQSTLQRQAAAVGKVMRYRIQVSTVDAACRIVAANLAVAIVPREGAAAFQKSLGLEIVALSNAWARRRFVVCARSDASLSVPARLLADSLRTNAAR
jgi:DNA-binding transcriptional LysR family regulator